jgi:hypothetical protein
MIIAWQFLLNSGQQEGAGARGQLLICTIRNPQRGDEYAWEQVQSFVLSRKYI